MQRTLRLVIDDSKFFGVQSCSATTKLYIQLQGMEVQQKIEIDLHVIHFTLNLTTDFMSSLGREGQRKLLTEMQTVHVIVTVFAYGNC